MTATEICSAARQISPRIQLRDVRLLLKQLQDKGLLGILNARKANGSVHELTPWGREAVQAAFGIAVDPSQPNIDCRK